MHIHGTVYSEDHRLTCADGAMEASCFAAGPIGKADVAGRDRIGVETIMFGSDFIHVEGTYPNSAPDAGEGARRVDPRRAVRHLHRQRRRILGLDLDALVQTGAAQKTWSWSLTPTA